MVICAEPPPKLKIPESKITELTDDANHDSPKLERRTMMHHFEQHRSCVVTLSDMELNDVQPHRLLQTLEVSKSPGTGSQCSLHEETPTDTNASHRRAIADAAWEALKRSIVYFRDQPTGIVAAIGNSQGAALNYDQVFMRDFIPSALAFLMKGKHLIVKNFLVETARLLSRDKMVDLFKLGQGVMPTSFKVHHRNPILKTESLLADFGETAIGRVAPVDFGLWWIILLRVYTRWTGDNSLAESPNCQRAMHLILSLCVSEGCDTSPALLCADGCSGDNSLAESPNCQRAMHLILRLCLSEGCDTSPALLCADGCSMIDQRMGICGYPIEKHALCFMTMMPALRLLKQDCDDDFVNYIIKRTEALMRHLHRYFSSPMGKRAICYGITWLIMKLCFGGACDTSLVSLADDDHSMIDMLNMCFSSGPAAFLAMPYADGHFCTGQEMLHIEPMESMKGCYPINTATVSLDGSGDQILASVRRGIARIRWWCKIEGKCVNISRVCGSNLEVFTTPADGTFHLTLVYESRPLTLCLKGRDLYLMGWRTEYGTFEIRLDSESEYMIGEDIIRLPFSKGYGTIAPRRQVGLTRMGPIPLQQAFEVLYKCRGEPSDGVKDSVGIFAVHFPEAARIRSVLNTVCSSFSEHYGCLLDTFNPDNSFWIKTYSHYSGELMMYLDALLSGTTPQAITNRGDTDVSPIQILRQIRILLRDAYSAGEFAHDDVTNVMVEVPLVGSLGHENRFRSSKDMGVNKKRQKSEQDGRQKSKVARVDKFPMGGDKGCPTLEASPPESILEDLFPEGDQDQQLKKDNEENEDNQRDEELIGNEPKANDHQKIPKIIGGKVHMSSVPADVDASYEDFFTLFPAIRKFIADRAVNQSSYTEKVVCRPMNASAGYLDMAVKDCSSSSVTSKLFPHSPPVPQRTQVPLLLHRPRLHPLQPLVRASRFLSKFCRFVL